MMKNQCGWFWTMNNENNNEEININNIINDEGRQWQEIDTMKENCSSAMTWRR